MRFPSFAQEPVSSLIETVGGANKVTLLIGAGASMEAGLPSWAALLERLLVRSAKAHDLVNTDDRNERDRWVTEATRDGVLGAAALVDVLAADERDQWLAEELFAPAATAESFFPGPIAREIPKLLDAFDGQMRLLTLNYDDLIEQALRDAGKNPVALATESHHVNKGEVPVHHLHGYLGRDGRETGKLVLSEADYQQMQLEASWQEVLVRSALSDSTVVFVGTSLIDPNMLRYLHAAATAGEGHRFAVFVRQGTFEKDVPSGIPPAREKALTARWKAVGVTAVFVDHFTDVAQLLSEVGRRRTLGNDYTGLDVRAKEWLETVESKIIGWSTDSAFQRSQRELNSLLRSALTRAVAVAESLGGGPWVETLALTLWLCDSTGEHMTSWVTTDRLHVDRATIEPVDVDEHSRWVAVRSYCRGTPLAEARDVYASRWRFIRGTPLVLESERHGRLPIGALTTASLAEGSTTELNEMAGAVEAAFNEALSDAVLTLLNYPFTEA